MTKFRGGGVFEVRDRCSLLVMTPDRYFDLGGIEWMRI